LGRGRCRARDRVGTDGYRSDDRRAASELLNERSAPARLARILLEDRNGAGRRRVQPPAQQIDGWRQLRTQVSDIGIARRLEEFVFDLIGAIDDDSNVVIKDGRQRGADVAFHPLRIVVVAQRECGALGPRQAFKLAQDPLAARGDRPLDQLLFARERDLVRPLRGTEYRDDDAHDRHGDDEADRHDEVQAHPVPPRRLPLLCRSRQCQSHNAILGRHLIRSKPSS